MATAMKQGTKTKPVDELKKLQKQIENKERDLKQREQILSSKQKECNDKEEELKSRQSDFEKRESALNQKMNLIGDGDSFHQFYDHIYKAYSLYVAQRGGDGGIMDTIDLVIKAKKNMVKK